ncbi:MAG: heme ABC exporter ATP-binding protein CcmA [Trueperaceae bacterium]|nr:heme ABC exporter ATP-binding protein CcmA [Trueperaceae bacterium]
MSRAAPAPTPPTPAIALEGLTRRWGAETVLRGVSLQVTAGRVVALRGRNGSGKTTLLRVLATRLRPSAGRARVFGHDVVRGGAAVRRCMAYLSVQSGSHGPLTAAENLRLAATLLSVPPGEVRERVDRALERVGLQAHANRPVRVFSSGMKRRLGLARLLLADAPLWLLDEPYASLDEDGRDLVDAMLRQAGREGRTVLLASHEAERIAPLVDAQLTLDQGRLSKAEP